MLSISDWSNDEAQGTVDYRGRTVEFTFHPGAYTGVLMAEATPLVDIVAACVTRWNIEGADPTNRADVEKLPLGLIGRLYRKIGELAAQGDEG